MQRHILHVGCGARNILLPREYAAYKEVRFDADPLVEPDVVGSCVAMPQVDSDTYDVVYAAHVLEHLFFHEAVRALQEFLRVLKPGGTLDLRVPDLSSIGGKIALDEGDKQLYLSGIGPVAPLDMIYGHRGTVAIGNPLMAHKSGYTPKVLERMLQRAGFLLSFCDTKAQQYELRVKAEKKNDSIFGVGGDAEGLEDANQQLLDGTHV